MQARKMITGSEICNMIKYMKMTGMTEDQLIHSLKEFKIVEIDQADHGDTALTFALKTKPHNSANLDKLMCFLLESGANPHQKGMNNQSLFSYALNTGNRSLLRTVVTCDLTKTREILSDYLTPTELTLAELTYLEVSLLRYRDILQEAALSNEDDLVELFLIDFLHIVKDAELPQQIKEQVAAAASTKQLSGIEVINKVINNYRLQLDMNQYALIELLTTYGIGSEHFCLSTYCRSDLTNSLRLLINLAEPNSIPNADELLRVASMHNQVEIVSTLLRKQPNIDVDSQDIQGQSALMLGRHSKEITRILLEEKANPNLKDIHGKTCFHMVCESLITTSDPSLLNLLIEHEADVNTYDNNLDTPLIILCRNYLPNMTAIQTVAQLCNNISAKNAAGDTALSVAAPCYDSSSVIKVLLTNGADPVNDMPTEPVPGLSQKAKNHLDEAMHIRANVVRSLFSNKFRFYKALDDMIQGYCGDDKQESVTDSFNQDETALIVENVKKSYRFS